MHAATERNPRRPERPATMSPNRCGGFREETRCPDKRIGINQSVLRHLIDFVWPTQCVACKSGCSGKPAPCAKIALPTSGRLDRRCRLPVVRLSADRTGRPLPPLRGKRNDPNRSSRAAGGVSRSDPRDDSPLEIFQGVAFGRIFGRSTRQSRTGPGDPLGNRSLRPDSLHPLHPFRQVQAADTTRRRSIASTTRPPL